MTFRSRAQVLTLVILAVLIMGSASAWACPGAEISSNDAPPEDNYVDPGTQIMVHGKLFKETESVELRWNLANQNAPDAPVLATALGTTWDVPVTIPDAEPGMYWIVSVGTYDESFSDAIEINIPGPVAEEAPAEEPPANEETPSQQPTNEGSSGRNPQGSPDRDGRSRQTGGDRLVTVVTGGAPQQPATSVANDGVVAVDASADPGSRSRASASPVISRPPHRIADGVHSYRAPAPEAQPHTAFALDAVTAQTERRPVSQVTIGVGLLAVGLVVMFAGFFLAEVRRGRQAEAAAEPNDLSS